MKCKSGVMPEQFEVRLDGKNALVILCENIEPVTTTSEDGTYTEYIYDRYTLVVPNRASLFNDVSDNFNDWLTKARQTEYDKLSADVRAKRNELLEESDKEFLIDRILPSSISTTAFTAKLKELAQSEMAKYRQALRDIPQQEGFPYNVTFPNKPQ